MSLLLLFFLPYMLAEYFKLVHHLLQNYSTQQVLKNIGHQLVETLTQGTRIDQQNPSYQCIYRIPSPSKHLLQNPMCKSEQYNNIVAMEDDVMSLKPHRTHDHRLPTPPLSPPMNKDEPQQTQSETPSSHYLQEELLTATDCAAFDVL